MYKILYFLLLSINLLSALPAYDEKGLLEQCSMNCNVNPLWTHQLNKLGIDKHFTSNNDSIIFQQSLLHKHYPLLNNNIPYISFAQLPTKVERLSIPCVKQQLYIKRDDLTGCSQNKCFYGGNKVRKLEFLLADALYHNAQSVMTFGCTGSNHALATSVYAKALGLGCSIFVMPQKNSYVVQQNLLMHQACGTDIHFYHTSPMLRIGSVAHWYDTYKRTGTFPYVIPTGGSNALGVLGFVNAIFELKQQIKDGQLQEPDYIYCACGSHGTAAGILLGLALTGLKSMLVGVLIEDGDKDNIKNQVIKLAQQSLELLQTYDSSIQASIDPERITINDAYIGKGYGVFSAQSNEALDIMYKNAHIALEGTYSAKAFAALINDCQSSTHHNAHVLFWNTYCGLDFSTLTAQVSFKSLPEGLQYFFSTPVQEVSA